MNMNEREQQNNQNFIYPERQASNEESWNKHHEKQLAIWKARIKIRRHQHRRAAQYHTRKRKYEKTYVPRVSMSLAGVATVIGFVASDSNTGDQNVMRGLRIFGACLTAIIAILEWVSQSNTDDELVRGHSDTAKKWENLFMDIEAELVHPRASRGESRAFIHQIKREYQNLIESSRDLPEHIVLEMEKEFPDMNHDIDVEIQQGHGKDDPSSLFYSSSSCENDDQQQQQHKIYISSGGESDITFDGNRVSYEQEDSLIQTPIGEAADLNNSYSSDRKKIKAAHEYRMVRLEEMGK